jgi:hypothetical protein
MPLFSPMNNPMMKGPLPQRRRAMPDQDPSDYIRRNPQVRKALEHLLKARSSAEVLKTDVWTFAVEMSSLLSTGCTVTELRLLVAAGYADHAEEITQSSDHGRSFRQEPRMTFGPRSCCVLTVAGAELADRLEVESDLGNEKQDGRGSRRQVPRWSATARELRVSGQVLKRFRRPAPALELLLAAFEEMGWPRHLDDPLPPEIGIDPQQRLHDAIKRLNACQQPQLIRFLGDGTGYGVKWEWVPGKNVIGPR